MPYSDAVPVGPPQVDGGGGGVQPGVPLGERPPARSGRRRGPVAARVGSPRPATARPAGRPVRRRWRALVVRPGRRPRRVGGVREYRRAPGRRRGRTVSSLAGVVRGRIGRRARRRSATAAGVRLRRALRQRGQLAGEGAEVGQGARRRSPGRPPSPAGSFWNRPARLALTQDRAGGEHCAAAADELVGSLRHYVFGGQCPTLNASGTTWTPPAGGQRHRRRRPAARPRRRPVHVAGTAIR